MFPESCKLPLADILATLKSKYCQKIGFVGMPGLSLTWGSGGQGKVVGVLRGGGVFVGWRVCEICSGVRKELVRWRSREMDSGSGWREGGASGQEVECVVLFQGGGGRVVRWWSVEYCAGARSIEPMRS